LTIGPYVQVTDVELEVGYTVFETGEALDELGRIGPRKRRAGQEGEEAGAGEFGKVMGAGIGTGGLDALIFVVGETKGQETIATHEITRRPCGVP